MPKSVVSVQARGSGHVIHCSPCTLSGIYFTAFASFFFAPNLAHPPQLTVNIEPRARNHRVFNENHLNQQKCSASSPPRPTRTLSALVVRLPQSDQHARPRPLSQPASSRATSASSTSRWESSAIRVMIGLEAKALSVASASTLLSVSSLSWACSRGQSRS